MCQSDLLGRAAARVSSGEQFHDTFHRRYGESMEKCADAACATYTLVRDLISRAREADALQQRVTELEAEHERLESFAEGSTRYMENAERDIRELRQHILDIDAHATPYGDIPDEPGWVGTYLVTAGALHRALGKVGYSAPKCEAEQHVATLTEALERIADPKNDDGFARLTSGRFSVTPLTSIARAALAREADRLEAAVTYNHGCRTCAADVGVPGASRAGLCSGHAETLTRQLEEAKVLLQVGLGTHGEPCPHPESCTFVRDARAALASIDKKGETE